MLNPYEKMGSIFCGADKGLLVFIINGFGRTSSKKTPGKNGHKNDHSTHKLLSFFYRIMNNVLCHMFNFISNMTWLLINVIYVSKQVLQYNTNQQIVLNCDSFFCVFFFWDWQTCLRLNMYFI